MFNVAEQHLRRLLPDAEDRQVLVNFLANVVNRPDEKQPFGVILQGRQGIGKTILAQWVAHLVGQDRSADISTWLRPASRFNKWLEGCQFAYGDLPGEASLAPLKAAIALGHVLVERKGYEPVVTPARANFFLTTGHFDPIRPGVADRRFVVLQSPAQPKDFEHDYFTRLVANGRADFEEFIRNV